MSPGLILGVLAALAQGSGGPPEAGGLRIEYVAHASFRIHSPGGTVVLIDPYADRVWLGYDFPKGLEADAVLVTHPHYDHDGGEFRGLSVPWGADETADMIAAVRPRYVVPMHYAIPELEPGDGPSDLGPLEPWLEGREGIVRLESNVLAVDAAHPLPEGAILVFRHSPLVVPPTP